MNDSVDSGKKNNSGTTKGIKNNQNTNFNNGVNFEDVCKNDYNMLYGNGYINNQIMDINSHEKINTFDNHSLMHTQLINTISILTNKIDSMNLSNALLLRTHNDIINMLLSQVSKLTLQNNELVTAIKNLNNDILMVRSNQNHLQTNINPSPKKTPNNHNEKINHNCISFDKNSEKTIINKRIFNCDDDKCDEYHVDNESNEANSDSDEPYIPPISHTKITLTPIPTTTIKPQNINNLIKNQKYKKIIENGDKNRKIKKRKIEISIHQLKFKVLELIQECHFHF